MPQPQLNPPLDHLHRLKEAFTRGGGIYPLKGIYYFASHPYFYPLLRARLLPCTLLSLFVLFNLFFWTYLPQVAVLALFHRSGSAWFNGTILVLGEGAVIVAILFEAWFVDETQVDIFDSVLVGEGLGELVSISRPVLPDEEELNPRTRLGKPTGKSIYAPFSIRQIVEFIILLPLNLVPYVGVPLFLLFTGYRAGPLLHWRYFKLKGMDRKTRNAFIKRHRWMYTWFGMIYLILQLVPVLSMMFLLTSAAGSGLWAVRLEQEAKEDEESRRDIVDPPPPYEDDPV